MTVNRFFEHFLNHLIQAQQIFFDPHPQQMGSILKPGEESEKIMSHVTLKYDKYFFDPHPQQMGSILKLGRESEKIMSDVILLLMTSYENRQQLFRCSHGCRDNKGCFWPK